MTRVRQRIETSFEAFAVFLCRNRLLAILAVLLATAVAGSGLRHVTIDTSTESFLHADDPVLARYEEFRAQFGRDDVIIVSAEPDALFTRGALLRLKALHEDLAGNVPHLADITSNDQCSQHTG